MNPQALGERIDQLFERYTQPGSPGCAVAVMKDGEIAFKKGYGLANLEHGVPISPSTVFNIGSEAKQFTALAVLLLAHEGKLALDDDIRQHLPEAPDFGDTITIRHLLHHTSGVRCSFPPLLMLSGWRESDITTNDEVFRLFTRQRELNFKPGEEHSYANMGYIVLARIVQTVSGQPFAKFCRDRIFKPLGMDSTVIHDNPWLIVLNRAQSYWENEGRWLNATLCDSVLGPTNVYTSVEDLARWDENFYTGQVGGQEVLKQMHERGVLNDGTRLEWACGLRLTEHRGLDVVEHGGGHGGYAASLVRFPGEHLSAVVLFNLFTMEARQFAIQVAEFSLEGKLKRESAPAPAEVRPVEQDEAVLKAHAGTYFNPQRMTTRRVVWQDGKLKWGAGFNMLPVGENRFVLEIASHIRIEFMPGPDGGPSRVQLIEGNEIYRYERVEPVAPAPEALKAYTGRYYSPELDVYWTVALEEKQLCVKRQRYVDTRLTPVFADAFTDDWTPIADFPMTYFWIFDRDEQGALTGFRVSDDRMRNLRFHRD